MSEVTKLTDAGMGLVIPSAPLRALDEKEIIADFYRRVCQRAERNMELTGVLEGAHWNALRQEMAALGIETT